MWTVVVAVALLALTFAARVMALEDVKKQLKDWQPDWVRA